MSFYPKQPADHSGVTEHSRRQKTGCGKLNFLSIAPEKKELMHNFYGHVV